MDRVIEIKLQRDIVKVAIFAASVWFGTKGFIFEARNSGA
jgi:hypothetical protein